MHEECVASRVLADGKTVYRQCLTIGREVGGALGSNVGEKNAFLFEPFYTVVKMIILPRQARDKHRKS